jgi:hypothetical protein
MATKKVDKTKIIKHGTDEHAALLGLRKAAPEDKLVLSGWTLLDMTAYGPQTTESYLTEVLRQKVSELKAGPPKHQGDPNKAGYLPPMFNPEQ